MSFANSASRWVVLATHGCLLLLSIPAFAQTPGPLDVFLANTQNATPGQVSVGHTVQVTCSTLANRNTLPTLTPQQNDLFAKCGEMVQTARVLEDIQGNTVRNLGVDRNGLLAVLQQVSGEEAGSQGSLATQVPSGQFSNISARLSSLRFGTALAASRGLLSSRFAPGEPVRDTYHIQRISFEDQDSSYGTRLSPAAFRRYAEESGGSSGKTVGTESGGGSLTASPWGWFTEGGYNFGDRDQTLNEDGFSFDSFSITAGVDYNFGNAVVGGSIGYDKYKADFDNSTLVAGGNSDVKGVSGSLFGAWFADRWSVNGIVSYGKLKSDLTRVVLYKQINPTCGTASDPCGADRRLRGSPDGSYQAVGATVAYDASLDKWSLSPSLSLNYRRVKIDAFDETDSSPTGGLALSYDEQVIKSFRSILGLSLSRPFSRSFGVLSPIFKAEWHHEFKDDARSLNMNYTISKEIGGIPGFSIPVDKPQSDYGVLGAGISVVYARRLQSYLYYERLVGISYLKSNAISIGLRGQF